MKKERVVALTTLLGVLMLSTIAFAEETSLIDVRIDNIKNIKQEVTIEVEAEDKLSGVREIVLPDGSTTTDEKTEYNVRQNGIYKFKSYDNANNMIEEEVEVTNVDNTPPIIKVLKDYENADWVRYQDIEFEITDNHILKSIKAGENDVNIRGSFGHGDGWKYVYDGLGNFKGAGYSFSYPSFKLTNINENGIYKIEVEDRAGNKAEKEVVVKNIDKDGPAIELDVNSDGKKTNQDVVINVKATDEQSGVKEIILPDGTRVAEEITTYTVAENGNYEFKAIDNVGNETIETIEITNIDKVPPVITIKPYETNWTNQDITVYAEVDKGTLNQDSYTFTENGSFTFIATDEAGNITEETIEVTNIDKTPPTMKIIVGE